MFIAAETFTNQVRHEEMSTLSFAATVISIPGNVVSG